MYEFFLRCKPEAQKRVKVFNRIAIDPSKEYKNFLKMQLLEQFHEEPLDEPLRVAIKFHMPIPKSSSKKKAMDMEQGLIRHTKKPDIDNLCKATLDALSKVVIRDDSIIYFLSAEKSYRKAPGIDIKIYKQNP